MKTWTFRLVAAGIPTILGAVAVFTMMVRHHFLAVDPTTGHTVIQQPLYLQEPGYETTGHKYLFDTRLGWRNIPNWQATTYGRTLRINSKGLRDREYPDDKPDKVARILVLGDSFTWGYGVANEEIFTERLEDRFRETGAGHEVINTGVSGWGTDQEYLFLVKEGFRYSPDVVVLAFFLMNDPVENVSSRIYEMNKPLFLDKALTLGNVPVPKPHEPPRVRVRSDPIPITLAIMNAMSQECADHRCQFVIMKFGRFLRPTSTVLLADEQVIEQEVENWPGTRYLDLDEAFDARGLSSSELTAGNSDGHWNAFGHQIVAEILHDFIGRSEIIKVTSEQ